MFSAVRTRSTSPAVAEAVNPLPAAPANETQPTGSNPQPSQLQRQQRHAVKAIARDCDTLSRVVNNASVFIDSRHKLEQIIAKLNSRYQQLEQLEAAGLSTVEPTPGAMRNARSGVALAAGAVSRAGALLAAGAVGAVEGGIEVAACPVIGVVGGALNGCLGGAKLPVGIATPVTAVVGLGVGAAVGGISGTFVMPFFAAADVLRPGSFARKTYVSVDLLAAARKHAQRKKQSTHTIAQETKNGLAVALFKATKKTADRDFHPRAPNMLNECVSGFAVIGD